MELSKIKTGTLLKVLFGIFLFSPLFGFSQIRGVVRDATTKDVITGVSIIIADKNTAEFSGLDGSYRFKDLAEGTYVVEAKFVGFKSEKKVVEIAADRHVVQVDFTLKPVYSELNAVTVKGKLKDGSDAQALHIEKESGNILNVVSARTIQLLPDITTASVLQRVSGISMQRSSTGDARYAIIRGMDQRYNYTLVNGIKIPSPDDRYRYVPMDMFPSELLDRLEVIKALTPAMEGDAIGGAMNLVMKNAPEKFTLNFNAGTGFSQLLSDRGYENFDRSVVNKQSPADIHGKDYVATPYDFTYKNFDYKKRTNPANSMFGFAIGNRFLKNKKLGVMLAGSYQSLYRGANTTWLKPNNQPQPGNVPSFDDIYIRRYNTQQTRYGLHSKIDYIINSKNKLSLYNIYMKLNEVQNRETVDTSLSIGRSGVGTGNTYVLFRSRVKEQSIYNSTLQGDHTLFNNFTIKWSAVYSLAKAQLPDWSQYQTVRVVGYDINGNPTATQPVLNIPFYRIWMSNSDQDVAGYLNTSYKTHVRNNELTISVGGLYRSKHRENKYNEWDLVPKTDSSGQAVIYDGYLTPDKFQFNGKTAAQGSPNNPLNYTATEKISAVYAMADLLIANKLSILGGLRIEHTEQGWNTPLDPQKVVGAYGDVTYTDLLPSIHFKYRLTPQQNFRLSYFSALNRPGFYEYVPARITGEDYDVSGNPNLQHATSNNFDFRYEYFPKGFDQILAGAFYKTISNPIETIIVFNGTSSATLMPSNAVGGATNYGFELAITKYWGHFGVSGNYTYTHSRITTSKLFYDSTYVYQNTTQTRPLQGQSPHIGNISLLYKNQKLGLDLQLACVYTGRKITIVSPYKDLDYWQKGVTQLDFSFEKRFLKHFTAFAKINNILNTPVIVEILQPNIYRTGKFALPEQTRDDRVTTRIEYYGQTYLFGIRCNFSK